MTENPEVTEQNIGLAHPKNQRDDSKEINACRERTGFACCPSFS